MYVCIESHFDVFKFC